MKRWAAVLAAIALVAVACGGSGLGGQMGPKNGGTLTVALDGDLRYADPSLVSDTNSLFITRQVVEGLVGLEPGSTSKIVPVLAASLPTLSADGKTYTFKLRSGVKFHDGTALDAAAVKFNYDRWMNFPKGDLQNNATYYKAAFGGFGDTSNVGKVDAPDASTVAIRLVHPQSNFLISQTGAAFGIQSPSAIKTNEGNNASLTKNSYALGVGGQGKSMVGTGPFMFSEWHANDHVTLVKNPSYWNSTAGPHLDRIVFKPLSDSAARVAALQSGAVDMIHVVDPSTAKGRTSSANWVVLQRDLGCNITQLGMNNYDTVNGDPNLLADADIRRAIAAAINKAPYVTSVYAGAATVADNWLPAGAQYYKREHLPTYSLSEARVYIAQSGVAMSDLTVELWYPTAVPATVIPDPKALATAVAADLTAAGFKVTLKDEAYSPNYLADQAAGKLQMWLHSYTCRWAGPDDILRSAFFGYTNGVSSPMFNYKNDDLDTLMTEALTEPEPVVLPTPVATGPSPSASGSVVTPSPRPVETNWPGAVAADWQRAQDLIRADMPTVPLVNANLAGAARTYVMGFLGADPKNETLTSVWLNK